MRREAFAERAPAKKCGEKWGKSGRKESKCGGWLSRREPQRRNAAKKWGKSGRKESEFGGNEGKCGGRSSRRESHQRNAARNGKNRAEKKANPAGMKENAAGDLHVEIPSEEMRREMGKIGPKRK